MNTLGEYRCINCQWAERLDIWEQKRPAGMHKCPDCGGTVRGYDEMRYTYSLHEFLKQ